MNEEFYPDYSDSILNLSCSILKHYGVTPDHDTIPAVDEILSRNYKHVVVILLDGLGMNILEEHLNPRDFLRRNLLKDYSSVFPPTTTASTTSFLSGKSPVEHGWLGWDVYFEKEDKTVTCFTNKLQGTEQIAADYDVVRKYFSYESIIDKINKTKSAEANAIFPFGKKGFNTLDKWTDAIKQTCKSTKKTFTYAYWENPDHQLHRDGIRAESIQKIITELNSKLLLLCEELKDTVVFITADHGHKNIYGTYLQEEYPDFVEMLERPVSLEPRAISFYVKDKYKSVFSEEFKKYFGEDYILFSKEDVLKKQLFGPGIPHENLTGIGDYVAVAVSDRTILWNKNYPSFKSHHAGLTKDEMRIPLICCKYKPRRHEFIIYYSLIAMGLLTLLICVL